MALTQRQRLEDIGQDLSDTTSDMLGTRAGQIVSTSPKLAPKVVRPLQKIGKNI